MFDKLSQSAYEGHTPKSTRGLIGEWIVSIASIGYAVYLFSSDTINSALSPAFAVAAIVVGVAIGFPITAKALLSERFREFWANNVYRFIIIFVSATIGAIVALISGPIFGYFMISVAGLVTAGAVARTILYAQDAQPS